MEYNFENIPKEIIVKGNFDSTCNLVLEDNTLSAIKKSKLKLKIVQMGNLPTIKHLSISLGTKQGNINIFVGNNNAEIRLEKGTSGHFNFTLWKHSIIKIGKGTTSNGVRIFSANSELFIGEDCMFSDNVLIQCSDQHGIVDISTGEITNDYIRKIVLKDHVWLARSTCIMPDVVIGEGSVIGTGTIVTGDVPQYSIVGGVPGRVLKSNITWTRPIDSLDKFSRKIVSAHKLQ